MRILVLEPHGYSETARLILESLGSVRVGPLERRILLEVIGDHDVFVVRLGHYIDREALSRADRLKVIVSPTTGLDHIDLEAARERHVTVLSLQGEREFLETITSTAEHAWGLLLALVRRIPGAHSSVLGGNWNRDRFKGWELNGRTLGIVGYGRLGRMVARYGIAFGMEVIAYDPTVRETEPPTRWVSLEEVLAASHCISLHLPLNENTSRIIGQKEFSQMRRGALLVNTSRGGLLEETALLEALETGLLGGAALDVLSDEQIPGRLTRSPLIHYAKGHDNLILTPHIGGGTLEAMERTEVFLAEKLKQWSSEHQLIGAKD